MITLKKFSTLIFILTLSSCANYKVDKPETDAERKYYSSKGFALIYEDSYFKGGVIGKKIQNDKIIVMHDTLKKNTPIKIINPDNSKTVDAKVGKKTFYPKIFNVVISKKVADELELDLENPYIELLEVKLNKTFIAKEAKIFEEERKVDKTVQTGEIEMDDLSNSTLTANTQNKKVTKNEKFIIVISDFYYIDSANNLKKELIKKTQMNNFSVIKISNNKYRLSVGPFKNFKALKSTYISLNNLGFDDLNVYKE